MNIWLMNHYASLMFRDKAGRHYWFAKKLEQRGHEVSVFCASTYHDIKGGVKTQGGKYKIEYERNTPFIFVKTNQAQGNGLFRVLNMINFYRGLYPAVKGYLKKHPKPDVIIASSVHPLTLVAGIKIAQKLQIPCICEIRDLWPEAIFTFGKAKENHLLGRILLEGEHWIYRKAHALIFTKEGDVDYLKERKWTTAQGGDVDIAKCFYINNGVDLNAYQEQAKTFIRRDADLMDASVFNVVYTGIIRPVNNLGNILDCAKLLKGKPGYEDIRFLIFGSGSELPALNARVQKENIGNVKLKGFVPRRFIPYVLSKSSVNILNYAHNQFNWARGNSSNKLFEYMASGKPIISTVKMGYSIIEKYQCGIELETGDPEMLASAIMKFHDMPLEERSCYGQNAAKGVKDFDFNVLTDKLINVIKSVTPC